MERKTKEVKKMSEQKVWVEKMPESCGDCEFCEDSEFGFYCSRLCIKLKYINREKDCPLHSIKDYKKELVNEVCEKISIELENETETYCEIRQCSSPHYQGDYVWFNYVKFRIFIAQILKEVE